MDTHLSAEEISEMGNSEAAGGDDEFVSQRVDVVIALWDRVFPDKSPVRTSADPNRVGIQAIADFEAELIDEMWFEIFSFGVGWERDGMEGIVVDVAVSMYEVLGLEGMAELLEALRREDARTLVPLLARMSCHDRDQGFEVYNTVFQSRDARGRFVLRIEQLPNLLASHSRTASPTRFISFKTTFQRNGRARSSRGKPTRRRGSRRNTSSRSAGGGDDGGSDGPSSRTHRRRARYGLVGLVFAGAGLLLVALVIWGAEIWVLLWRVATAVATIGAVFTYTIKAGAALTRRLGVNRGSKDSH